MLWRPFRPPRILLTLPFPLLPHDTFVHLLENEPLWPKKKILTAQTLHPAFPKIPLTQLIEVFQKRTF